MWPYTSAHVITKSDTVNFNVDTANPSGLPETCEAIYVGGAGVVVVVFENNRTAAFTCTAGQVLPVRAERVNSTSTTATLMLALYRN